MSKLRPLHNGIIFQFEDKIGRSTIGGGEARTQFKDSTDWGFEVTSYDEGIKRPRWGVVVTVGEEVDRIIRPGIKILIEPLMWSSAFSFEQEQFWKTDIEKVLAYK